MSTGDLVPSDQQADEATSLRSFTTQVSGGHVDTVVNAQRVGDIHVHEAPGARWTRRFARPEEIAAAQQTLEELPLDAIPAPGLLPPGSRMTLTPNPLFVGREGDLRELARTLKAGDAIAIGQVQAAAASGLGGMGKTQLACEFAYRYGRYFEGGVYWLSFATPADIPSQVAECGRAGHMDVRPDFNELPLDDQEQLVVGEWRGAVPRLLIFDNCEDEETLATWKPAVGESRVLVTARRGQWDDTLAMKVMPLGTLNRQESVTLLRRHRPDLPDDSPELDQITSELGDLPLALHLAGSYLKRYANSITPTAYVEQLQQPNLLQHRSLEGTGRSPTEHELSVERTFALSYDKLDADSPIDVRALSLLARAACFAPGEVIPRAILLATITAFDDRPDAQLNAEDALARLVELGLLEVEAQGSLRLHRLLAAFVREVMPYEQAQGVVEFVLAETTNRFVYAQDLAALTTLQPHLRFARDMALERMDLGTAALSSALGRYLRLLGSYKQAQPYLEQALALFERHVGSNHLFTAVHINNLAVVLQAQGEYASARLLLERALAIREQAFGFDHLDTALNINNLASVMEAQGDYTGARSLYERALAIRERAADSDNLSIANSLSNLGNVLRVQGDYAAARALLERTLAIREQVLGIDHPATASSLSNLGGVLQAQGNHAGARSLQERALAAREQALGPDHPDTATSLNNLASVLSSQGNISAAKPLYERALAIREQTLGSHHPDTATSLSNLAGLLEEQGEVARAKSLYERTLAISEQVLGPDHPDTAISLSNLASLLRLKGDYAVARPLYERALSIHERTLGSDHPSIATDLNNLANVLEVQGDTNVARQFYERALAIRERALGPDHPDVAISLNNLAGLLSSQGDYAGARPLLERALVIQLRVLGPDHPDVARGLNNLAVLLREQGDYTGARPLYERALAIYEPALGPDHPYTRKVRDNLDSLPGSNE